MTSERERLEQEVLELRQRVAELEATGDSVESASGIVGALPIPVLIKDSCLKWVWGNNAMCDMLHLEHGSLAGLTDEAVHGRENAREIHECDRAVLATGGPLGYEKILTFGNACYHLSVLKTLWHPEKDKEPYVLSVVRDVTAMRTAENEARESRERFGRVLRNTPMGVHMYELAPNGDLIFTDANPAADLLTGRNTAALRGKLAHTVFPDMEKLGLTDIYRNVAETGSTWSTRGMRYPDQPDKLFDVYAFRISEGSVAVQFEDVTHAAYVSEQLKINENRYRSLFNSSPIPMWEFDFSGVKRQLDMLRGSGVDDILSHVRAHQEKLAAMVDSVHVLGLNPACMDMLEASSVREASDHIENMFDFPELMLVLEQFLNMEKGLQVDPFLVRACTVKGSARTIKTHFSPLPGHEERLDRVLLTITDETERLRAEKAVTESEERLRLVLSATKDGIWDWDMNSGNAYFSPSYYTMLGYRSGEFEATEQAWLDLVHPDDRDRTVNRIRAGLEHGNEFSTEFRMRAKTGRWVWILGRGRVVERDEQGRPLRTVGSHADITALKRVQEELLEHKNLFEAMADNLFDMLWAKDTEGNYLFANKALRNAMHMNDGEELIGRNDLFFAERLRKTGMTPRFSGKHVHSDMTVLHTGHPERYEEEYAMDEGRMVYDVRKSPLFDRHGKLIGTVGMGRDITETKQAQATLVRAKEAAESAVRSKDQFLANMSHEIRTPMNGVLGMLQLLNATPLNGEQTEYVETALESGRGLLSVINDILDFSKMQSGGFSLARQEFTLHETMRTVLRSFSVQARDKRIGLSYEVAPDMPQTLIGDDARLRQILFNLVGNAVKFTHSGNVGVRADHLGPHKGGVMIGLEVSDTGIGIPESLLQKVFDPFTQADGSFSRQYQGTGLGLGIVRSLVERMGGTLSIDSEEKQGTAIYATLLLDLPECETAPAHDKPAPEPAKRPQRVLVVEDDEVNRFTTKRYLEKSGYAVCVAHSGEEAVSLCSGERFDCILMDIQMPGMDGMAATRKIREAEKGKDTPVVALTAHAMQGDRERFLAAGMDGYASKPLELEELAAAVATAIANGRQS
ncbi:PAS domain-containing hybrid sensor histidine kinase/response regulator [Pseudodesulfovibrio senegalensis]|uniref:histidine kinase n=1 Tax=Pseudodesulfovibrio senegalensis TaxID=1721087 RepID=A0A6N6N0T2_9BACT|nr:PAS domain S-box protein [Pseudodesulfovibrio senegalensis]KAB1439071.1 PAS domain S-box protein [Pseudodesulfovibrio senegalensis]